MNTMDFNTVIDFAVKREEQAVTFYSELQDLVKFQERKSFLKELEDMERSHIEILEKIRSKGMDGITVPEVKTLKISESTIAPEPAATMDYQDILLTGMKKEEEAVNLYIELAETSPRNDMRTLFKRLAAEEEKHKKYFETIYDEEILTEN